MSAERYTQEQILSGIRIVWREELRLDLPFTADTRIDEQLKAEGVFDAIDICEVICDLERIFDFTCPRKDWEDFFGCNCPDVSEWEKTGAARCTFRGLADFVAERLNPIPLEPVTLLGRSCLTAGIFRSLQQVAVQVNPRVLRFAPSTPIRECLRGFQLRRFWNRLRWMLEDQIPPPSEIHLSSRSLLHSLAFKLAVGLAIALWRRDFSGVLAGILTTFALFVPVGIIVEFINQRLNPLPEGIETFGDLARVLAAIIRDQQAEGAAGSPAA